MLCLLTKAVLAALIALAASSAVATADDKPFPPADEKALVEIIEKGVEAQRQPGLNVGIWVPGRGAFTRAFGTGDLASKAPMDLTDHVRIASITKTFTAVATLRLVDQGRLALDDTLSTYVAGIDNGDRITIRNLLGMTSGVYDFTRDEEFLKDFIADPLMAFSAQDLLAIVKRHEPDFAPDEKVVYCDTNYSLLGMIISKVTGKTAGEVITDEVIMPLGLTKTSFPTDPTIPSPFAHGYYAGEDGKGPLKDYTATNPAVASTAGAMISTVGDLRVWARALATGQLLTPATYAEQMTFGTMMTAPVHLGYGLGIGDFGGLIGHNGAIFGYTTAMFYWPEADAVIVISGNQSSNAANGATEIALQIARYLFPGKIR